MAAIFASRLRQALVLYLLALFAASIAAGDGWTHKHEAGRCAIRGHCGKKSLFGKELPCPDNGLAEEPDNEVRKKLVDICGDKWSEGLVCCRGDQVCRSLCLSRGYSHLTLIVAGRSELESQTRRIPHFRLSGLQDEFL